MKLDTYVDEGYDLNVGDIVFIKFEVIKPPTASGDTELRYFARNGKNEYAARRVNAIFIKRPSKRWVKRIWNYVARRCL